MKKLTFKLENGEEFITLVNLLKYLDIINSGGEIKYLLDNKKILYNNQAEFRKRKKCYTEDVISIPDYGIIIEIK